MSHLDQLCRRSVLTVGLSLPLFFLPQENCLKAGLGLLPTQLPLIHSLQSQKQFWKCCYTVSKQQQIFMVIFFFFLIQTICCVNLEFLYVPIMTPSLPS